VNKNLGHLRWAAKGMSMYTETTTTTFSLVLDHMSWPVWHSRLVSHTRMALES
jgi:hypothetical protein